MVTLPDGFRQGIILLAYGLALVDVHSPIRA